MTRCCTASAAIVRNRSDIITNFPDYSLPLALGPMYAILRLDHKMKGNTMDHTIIQIDSNVKATRAKNQFGGYDYRAAHGGIVRLVNADAQINVYVLNVHGVLLSSATFTGMPNEIVAHAINSLIAD